ncbi:lipopolysaccharide export system permease protein [Mucilaginibacter gracilis]|uniref:Lipopolysaccharide export system permease protein n=1 Tax=Mucilaginibacter gracilis TaxID=423350 RepID=A0A495J2C9_9SPHI|nr:lipopolysaccharide export system permease protein [Mucilaginibacter gracilis]
MKAFIRPFIVTFFIVMFVLLMLFLWKYIDDLIGKGFEWYTILDLMMYASATNVAMALPLSVLLSSIMTYGTLGENYELVAIKSAGISLGRALYPMIIVVIVLSISAFVFSDYMLPVANLKFYSLLYDARKQKSASLVKEGVFNNSFPGYTIRVQRKDPDGQLLHGIMIFEKPVNGNGSNNVIFAQEGRMFRSADNTKLVLKLKNGIRYEETSGNTGYNPRQVLTRMRFKETETKLSLDGFTIKRTPENDFRSSFLMLSSSQLVHQHDSVSKSVVRDQAQNLPSIIPYIKYMSMPHKYTKPIPVFTRPRLLATVGGSYAKQLAALNNAMTEAKAIKDYNNPRTATYLDKLSTLRRYLVEYQRKFTLSAACLVLFLIGAPLGAIIRKGGLGLPVVISVIFFLIYYIISTIGEKSAKDGSLSPFIGTWISILILTPIGLFLSYKAANDSVLFDLEIYRRFFASLFKKKESQ